MTRPTFITDPTTAVGQLPMVSQPAPAEGRVRGLTIDCPLCPAYDAPTWLHPIDSRQDERRESVYASDERPVTNVLCGCERGEHYVVLELTNLKGAMNLGFRAPYNGEIIAEWKDGSFDNWVQSKTVRFNPDFEVNS